MTHHSALLKPKAVILTSGGLDSTTVLAMADHQGYELYALNISYGQRHYQEMEALKRVLASYPHAIYKEVTINLQEIGGSALTDATIKVPKSRNQEEMQQNIPVTYVPARNTIFLSIALSWAEVLGARDIFLGINAIDYSGYPDCRPQFIEAFAQLANVATAASAEGGVRFNIHTPLLKLSKAEIIRAGLNLGVDYSITLSCYDPTPKGEACGICDACYLRLKGFAENGLKDPAPYKS